MLDVFDVRCAMFAFRLDANHFGLGTREFDTGSDACEESTTTTANDNYILQEKDTQISFSRFQDEDME